MRVLANFDGSVLSTAPLRPACTGDQYCLFLTPLCTKAFTDFHSIVCRDRSKPPWFTENLFACHLENIHTLQQPSQWAKASSRMLQNQVSRIGTMDCLSETEGTTCLRLTLHVDALYVGHSCQYCLRRVSVTEADCRLTLWACFSNVCYRLWCQYTAMFMIILQRKGSTQRQHGWRLTKNHHTLKPAFRVRSGDELAYPGWPDSIRAKSVIDYFLVLMRWFYNLTADPDVTAIATRAVHRDLDSQDIQFTQTPKASWMHRDQPRTQTHATTFQSSESGNSIHRAILVSWTSCVQVHDETTL